LRIHKNQVDLKFKKKEIHVNVEFRSKEVKIKIKFTKS
jgi:hypothetical protein